MTDYVKGGFSGIAVGILATMFVVWAYHEAHIESINNDLNVAEQCRIGGSMKKEIQQINEQTEKIKIIKESLRSEAVWWWFENLEPEEQFKILYKEFKKEEAWETK